MYVISGFLAHSYPHLAQKLMSRDAPEIWTLQLFVRKWPENVILGFFQPQTTQQDDLMTQSKTCPAHANLAMSPLLLYLAKNCSPL